MLRNIMRSFILSFALFLITLHPALAAVSGITDVTITRGDANQTSFALEITKDVPYRVFVLNNPPRMVIDLPKMEWHGPLNKGDRNGTIKSYRRGTYQNDTLRIVIDLSRPAILSSSEKLAASQNHPWNYIFTLKPVDAVTFQKAINKVITGNGAPSTATNGAVEKGAAAIVKKQEEKSEAVAEEKPTPEPKSKPTQIASTTIKKPLIVIDAGHGGVDPGARATNGIYEKNITLATAKEVKRLLEESGKYRVKLTRDTDIYIKLPDRVRIARQAGADMFISLHADTISRPNVMGSSVYTLSDKASDEQTAKLADRENAVDTLVNVDVGKVDADVADILIDLVTRDTMNQSKVLADTVVGTFKNNGIHTLPITPHRSAGFAVLKSPDIPSILIEMGYLSNQQEADQLASASYRTKLAGAVTRVVDRFFTTTSKLAAY
jgi:N-acetylmuramoyl-L-alanine amidase